MRLRLLSYNVHSFRAGVARVAEVVAHERPDVVFLNEARGPLRLRAFARRLGMEAVSAVRPLWRGIPNAVLLRPPLRAVTSETLGFSRTRRLIRRGAVVVSARREGVSMTAVAVHLGLSDPERLVHARELTDRLAASRPPVAVGGDLNEGPDGAAARWVGDRLFDAHVAGGTGPGHTFPARDPRARIDYLFVSAGVAVTSCRVVTTAAAAAASDHLPVVADVEIGEGP